MEIEKKMNDIVDIHVHVFTVTYRHRSNGELRSPPEGIKRGLMWHVRLFHL